MYFCYPCGLNKSGEDEVITITLLEWLNIITFKLLNTGHFSQVIDNERTLFVDMWITKLNGS